MATMNPGSALGQTAAEGFASPDVHLADLAEAPPQDILR